MLMCKRILSALLALVLIVAMVPPVYAGAEETNTNPTIPELHPISDDQGAESEAVTVETRIATEPTELPAEPAETTLPAEETTVYEEPAVPETEETTVPETEKTAAPETEETTVPETEETTAPETEETTVPETEETTAPETEETAGPETETTSPEETFSASASELEDAPVASGSCGENLTWKLDDEGVLTFTGFGAMESLEYYGPWHSYADQITAVCLDDRITHISDNAFSEFEIAEIMLPQSLEGIGNNAFYACQNLKEVTIPAAVTQIGRGAFGACKGIKEIHFLGDAPSFDENAFGSPWGYLPTTENISAVAYYPADNDTWTDAVMKNYGGTITWMVEGSVPVVDTGVCGRYLKWMLDENGLLTISGTGAMKDYSNWSDEKAPWNTHAKDIKNVVVASGVTTVGSYAFVKCPNLTIVTLPESLTSIGSNAFYDCDGLTNVTLSEGLQTICSNGFGQCENLAAIVIPNSVTRIEQYAFSGCRKLESVTIGQSLTHLGEDAFAGTPWYDNLVGEEEFVIISGVLVEYQGTDTEVVIPSSVKVIGSNVFQDVDITAVTIPSSVTTLQKFAFASCEKLKEITLPASIQTIEENAFYDCSGLKSIIIPQGVTAIGESTFDQCEALERITIPSSVTKIGDYAFRDCTSLKAVELPAGIKTIGCYAFMDCASLTSIDLPDSLTKVDYSAFCRCTDLEEVSIGAGLRVLENNLFEGCTSLTEVTIPCSIARIEYSAFYGCKKLKDIDFQESYSVFGGLEDPWGDEDEWEENFGDPGTQLEIQGSAFGDCDSLTEVSLPKHLTSLYSSAFRGSDNTTKYYVKSAKYYSDDIGAIYEQRPNGTAALICIPARISGDLVISDHVAYVYTDFYGCSELTSITFSPAAGGIHGDGAFYGCTKLTKIVAGKGNESYYNDASGALIYNSGYSVDLVVIPANLNTYTIPAEITDINMAGFSNAPLKEIIVQTGNEIFFTLDGVLYANDDYYGITLTKYPGSKSGNSYVVPSNVECIGGYSFRNLANLKEIWLTSEDIPDYSWSSTFDQTEDGNALLSLYYPENIGEWSEGYSLSESGIDFGDSVKAVPYTMLTLGTDTEFYGEAGDLLAFRTQQDLTKLTAVKVDGKTIPASSYMVSAPGGIVRFQQAYQDSLMGTAHTIRFQYSGSFEEISVLASKPIPVLTESEFERKMHLAWERGEEFILDGILTLDSNSYLNIGYLQGISATGNITIPSGTTVRMNAEDIPIEGTIIIERGGQLWVQNGCALTFLKDSKLDIQTGGRLTLQSGNITIQSGASAVNNGIFQVYHGGTLSGTVTGRDPIYLDEDGNPVVRNQADLEKLLLQAAAQDSSVWLATSLTLERDLEIPENCYLILRNCTLTVPTGVTLTNNDYIRLMDEAKLAVASGGALVNNDSIYIDTDCTLQVDGSYTHGQNAHVYISGDTSKVASISGVDKAYQYVEFNDATAEMFAYALSLQNQGYALIDVSTTGFVMNGNVTIGENVTLWVRPDWNGTECLLTINGDVLLNGKLGVEAYDSENYARVQNNGTLTVGTTGTLIIRGQFLGNEPVYAPLTQNDLESMLAEKNTVVLDRTLVLERNLTLKDSELSIAGNGCLTVPANITLTNEAFLNVSDGGRLEVRNGGKLINREYLSNEYGSVQIDGTYVHEEGRVTCFGSAEGISSITGIDKKYQILLFINADQSTLLHALEYQDEGYLRVNINTYDMTLNSNVTIGESTQLNVSPDYSGRGGKLTINSDVILNGALYVDRNEDLAGIVQNNGSITVNKTGSLRVDGIFLGNPPINNGGSIYIHSNEPITQDRLEELLQGSEDVILEEPLVLSRNLTIDSCDLYIAEGGQLTVPKNVTLTVNGRLYIDGGKLLVLGKLVNNKLVNPHFGILDMQGTYQQSADALLAVHNEAQVLGISKKYQNLMFLNANEEEIYAAIRTCSEDYAFIEAYTDEDVTITQKITIPKKMAVEIRSDTRLTITGDVTVDGYLLSHGALVNNGSLTINKGGYLIVTGSFGGNAPILNGGTIWPEVESIDILEQDQTVDISSVKQITLTVSATLPEDFEDASAIPCVTWTSSNAKIVNPADIISNGNGSYTIPFTGKALGKVTLTATSVDGTKKTDSITLNVTYLDQVKKLTVSAEILAIGLQPGETVQMLVYGSDTETPLNVSFPGALKFETNKSEVAEVNETTGMITAGTKAGTATITASLPGDPMKRKVNLKVKTIAAQAEALVLDRNEFERNLDELTPEDHTFTLTATPVYKEAVQKFYEDRDLVLPMPGIKWTSSNKKLATVAKDGTVTIREGASGSAVITAQSTDKNKAQAHLILTVQDRSPKLESNKLTLNPMQTCGTSVSLVECYGNGICDNGITLHEYDKAAKAFVPSTHFKAAYADDILEIRCAETAGEIKNGSYQLQLKADCEAFDPAPYLLTLKVKSSEPSVAVKQTEKVNLFIKNSRAQLTVTAKNGRVLDAKLQEESSASFKNIGFDPETGILTLEYASWEAPLDKKVDLEIEVEGYKSISRSVTISTVNAKPKLKLSTASSVINTAVADNYRTYFTVIDQATGKDLELGSKEVITVSSKQLTVTADVVGNTIVLDLTGANGAAPQAGSVDVFVKLNNWTESIKLTHKISVSTKDPTLKPMVTTLKLNSSAPDQMAETPVIMSQQNIKLDTGWQFKPSAATEKKHPGIGQQIKVSFADGVITAAFADGADVDSGTYEFTAIPTVNNGYPLAILKIKVKVIN